ncbi:hypothetical protein GGI42DRAFT_144925 [Trichoderma sp. SZMC 28013]
MCKSNVVRVGQGGCGTKAKFRALGTFLGGNDLVLRGLVAPGGCADRRSCEAQCGTHFWGIVCACACAVLCLPYSYVPVLTLMHCHQHPAPDQGTSQNVPVQVLIMDANANATAPQDLRHSGGRRCCLCATDQARPVCRGLLGLSSTAAAAPGLSIGAPGRERAGTRRPPLAHSTSGLCNENR